MPKYSEKELMSQWDKLTVSVFTGSNSAFYGSLLCSMDVQFDDSVEMTTIDPNMVVKWNKDFFMESSQDVRKYVLMKEVEHVARLHYIRKGSRDDELWNTACDYEINADLKRDNYNWGDLDVPYDPKYVDMPAEDIYDILQNEQDDDDQKSDSQGSFGNGVSDMQPSPDGNPSDDQDGDGEGSGSPSAGLSTDQMNNLMNSVIRATQSAKLAGSPMGSVDSLLNKFLKPQVPWDKLLRKYMRDKLKKSTDWGRSHRRFHDIYLPRKVQQQNGLMEIAFYLDTSGSISDEMVRIFNSEVKHIHETYNPKSIRLVQFDTSIRHEIVYNRGTKISKMKVSGRGGTDLQCVHDHIKQTKPTVAVVLTDMYCHPMPVINGLEVLWVVFDNPNAVVLQGKVSHVNTRGQ